MRRKKFTWKRFFKSHLFFVIGVVVVLLLSISLGRAQLQDRTIRNEIAKLHAEADALEQERNQYEELLALLETPEFLEKEARRALGYVRPGEQMVVIEKGETQEQEELDISEMSNPKKWWVYFFGKI